MIQHKIPITKSVFGEGPQIMGIVNVTPDSFSDGGSHESAEKAIARGLRLAAEGAKIIDVGGESTRPGAAFIDEEEEIRRVVPVIEGLKGHVDWISIDTRKAGVMRAALAAGANVINDISALTHDSESMSVVVQARVPVILMHMQGTPQTMQKNPSYNNVVEEIFEFLKERISYFDTNRLGPNHIFVDPGIGFGKTLEHNIAILSNITRFRDLGVNLAVGTSRKSFIGALSKDEKPEERLAGSIASVLFSYQHGVHIFRVHDVKETAQALKVFQALSFSGME